MARIDADAHVDETDATWDYLVEGDERFRPVTTEDPAGKDQRWSVDGLSFRRPVRDYQRTGATAATSQLLDVDARLAHLDELRIDLQVLFPTMFIRSRFAGHEDAEIAITRAYNRWIADRTSHSGGRLRWVAVLPLLSIDESVKELEWATEHGAVGVFKKGFECGHLAGDRYFHPLYEAAAALNVPICVHTGSDGPAESLSPVALDAVRAFYPLVTSDVFDRFPALRVGIIESGSSWVPFMLNVLGGSDRRNHLQAVTLDHEINVDFDLFRRLNIYVSCQSHDDLPYVLQYGLEDNLIVGTDYTHADASAELKALDNIESRGATGNIPPAVAQKILDDNARRFYGL